MSEAIWKNSYFADGEHHQEMEFWLWSFKFLFRSRPLINQHMPNENAYWKFFKADKPEKKTTLKIIIMIFFESDITSQMIQFLNIFQ